MSKYPSIEAHRRERGDRVVAIHAARGELVQRRAGRHQRRGLALDGRLELSIAKLGAVSEEMSERSRPLSLET